MKHGRKEDGKNANETETERERERKETTNQKDQRLNAL